MPVLRLPTLTKPAAAKSTSAKLWDLLAPLGLNASTYPAPGQQPHSPRQGLPPRHSPFYTSSWPHHNWGARRAPGPGRSCPVSATEHTGLSPGRLSELGRYPREGPLGKQQGENGCGLRTRREVRGGCWAWCSPASWPPGGKGSRNQTSYLAAASWKSEEIPKVKKAAQTQTEDFSWASQKPRMGEPGEGRADWS